MKLIDKLKPYLTEEEMKFFNTELNRYDIFQAIEKCEFDSTNEIKVEKIIELLEQNPIKEFTNNNIDSIANIINTDDFYFSDIECINGCIKRIEYPPFKTLFHTSGKIIIENDLRSEFLNDLEEPDFDVNYIKGKIDCSQFYADRNLLHGFIGNSCPSVYYSKEEEVILIGTEYDEETEEVILPNETYKRLTGICTDLWWYSICDSNSIKNPERFDQHCITAGTWELEHYYGITNTKYHEKPYAKLKLINKS